MYFERFVIKLRLIHSAVLTSVNKEAVSFLFVFFFKGKSKYKTNHLTYGPSGN